MILKLTCKSSHDLEQISELIRLSINEENNNYICRLSTTEYDKELKLHFLSIHDKDDVTPSMIQLSMQFENKKEALYKLEKMLPFLPTSRKTVEKCLKRIYPFSHEKRLKQMESK